LQIPSVKAVQGGILPHGVCSEPVYSKRLLGDHVLRQSESFLHVRADGTLSSMPKFSSTRPSCSTVLVKKITLGMTTCWSSANDGRATSVTAHLFPSPSAMWRWLLSEYQEEDGSLPPAEDVERWKQKGPDPDDLLGGQEECSAESLSKRKAAAKSSRGEAISLHAKDGSPSRKKPRLPFTEKTQVGSSPSSSARVKHLVGADGTKVGDIPLRSSSHLHRSKDRDRSGRSAHDLALLNPLAMRLAEAKKVRESSAWAKGSSSASAVGPKVNKSSSVRDACVSDLLKMNFLSNPSSCAELGSDIPSIQKGLIFAVETIRNSSAVAPSSAQLSELEKKNAKLASQLSAKQARYEKKTSDLRAMISGLKSSLTEKDSELNSSATDLASRKDAFFRLEQSKSEATIDAYKLAYLHCADRTDPLYAIDDVTGEDEAEVDAIDEMMAYVMIQADGAAEGVAGQRYMSTRVLLGGLWACIAYTVEWFPLGSWRVPGSPLRDSECVLHIP
ncbi:hypothetical protein Prudu_1504S000300, partial [Prunus dulcis]